MHESIYEPAEDSFLLRDHIKDYSFKSALDVGTGSGIIVQELLKHCDTVVGVDLNTKAIEFCQENIEGCKFIVSDLFDKVEWKFDLITFNAPYLPKDEGIEDIALYGGKEGYEVIEKFLLNAKNYLNNKGKILMIFTSHSKPDKIKEIMDREGYKYKLVDKVHVFFEDIFLYELRLK